MFSWHKLAIITILIGSVTYYNPKPMQRVYEYRISTGEVQPCTECIGMVALMDNHLGQKVWLQRDGFPPEGPFLCVDVAARKDYIALIKRGLVAEVDYATAMRWQMTGPLKNVKVYLMQPLIPRPQ